ncbi:MAG: hypothetical protein DME88_16415 [Verrucomicrobia bacterium]|nr:MAG: hypothetical protein DME88_16415 [Verrucomicrobiota bacterium]
MQGRDEENPNCRLVLPLLMAIIALTRATLQNIQRSGECWCGGSTWHGKAVIRISVCDWATTPKQIERSVRAFVKARAIAAR